MPPQYIPVGSQYPGQAQQPYPGPMQATYPPPLPPLPPPPPPPLPPSSNQAYQPMMANNSYGPSYNGMQNVSHLTPFALGRRLVQLN